MDSTVISMDMMLVNLVPCNSPPVAPSPSDYVQHAEPFSLHIFHLRVQDGCLQTDLFVFVIVRLNNEDTLVVTMICNQKNC